jgi:hypothetical protein
MRYKNASVRIPTRTRNPLTADIAETLDELRVLKTQPSTCHRTLSRSYESLNLYPSRDCDAQLSARSDNEAIPQTSPAIAMPLPLISFELLRIPRIALRADTMATMLRTILTVGIQKRTIEMMPYIKLATHFPCNFQLSWGRVPEWLMLLGYPPV